MKASSLLAFMGAGALIGISVCHIAWASGLIIVVVVVNALYIIGKDLDSWYKRKRR